MRGSTEPPPLRDPEQRPGVRACRRPSRGPAIVPADRERVWTGGRTWLEWPPRAGSPRAVSDDTHRGRTAEPGRTSGRRTAERREHPGTHLRETGRATPPTRRWRNWACRRRSVRSRSARGPASTPRRPGVRAGLDGTRNRRHLPAGAGGSGTDGGEGDEDGNDDRDGTLADDRIVVGLEAGGRARTANGPRIPATADYLRSGESVAVSPPAGGRPEGRPTVRRTATGRRGSRRGGVPGPPRSAPRRSPALRLSGR